MMIRTFGVCLVLASAQAAMAAPPVKLSQSTYEPDQAVLVLQVNWGRVWKCNRYENAQLQALSFKKAPFDATNAVLLQLETPSKLFVDNRFLPYTFIVQPGEYALAGFDVKIARTVRDIAHIKGSEENLLKEGKPVGGTFTVNAGEIVYVGSFGLDCGEEPFLWRYYLKSREEFENYIAAFRQMYPFLKDVPVHFRLFSTSVFGTPFALQDGVVK